ncbi:MAG: hypothetical protein SVP52_07615 [Chloroflexota bacterium]|nr:hypothetical protein [Chloroflexota bacterium]
MNTTLPETALILVAILPSQRDFDIARLFGWYRIPLKSSPKVISVDYLAFYQTKAFGESERWQISYVAEILGHELTRRRELIRDEPNHPRAHEEYFKIQIGPIQRLENPVPAGDWKRITFFYTTGEQFQRAKTINDLVIKAQDEREVLWHTLRERALKANEYQAADLPQSVIDPAILALLGEFGAF